MKNPDSTNAVKSGQIAENGMTSKNVHLNHDEYLNMIEHDFH